MINLQITKIHDKFTNKESSKNNKNSKITKIQK